MNPSAVDIYEVLGFAFLSERKSMSCLLPLGQMSKLKSARAQNKGVLLVLEKELSPLLGEREVD
eukprot:CAMPEP_0170511736 /NCGR_PEP_ID=MMETSP0208-20121228/66465_1 /TAXON_ID=197538 /ORGANISM="Strombidium inclinatum, Strain S3" /LENGTH=63 /DNA_ID=CAMNT_0010795299 /DNA_START=883 /DNA_END=1074 /DNA_ORIENTATION=-